MAKKRMSYTQTGYTKPDNVNATKSFLKNQYLLTMTFSHLQVEIMSEDTNRQCLLYAALTCKDFLDVALDELWKRMDSLLPVLKLLPALQFEDDSFVCANVHVFFMISFRLQVLGGNVSKADWDRLQYYTRRVKDFTLVYDNSHAHPSTYVRIAQLQSSTLFPSLRRLYCCLEDSYASHIFLFLSPLLDSLSLSNIGGFENTVVGPFLATLSSSPQMLSHIVLDGGEISADILKKSFVHFKQLRSLVLEGTVFMADFSLWEVLGALPSLEDLTLEANDPASHPAHAPENSNSRSEGLSYFDALEKLSITGSFILIQHFLDFIDSPCLKSINVSTVIDRDRNEHDHAEDFLTPSMTIVASKWSQSLTYLVISNTLENGITHRNSKFLTSLTDLHEIRTFKLFGWTMENNDDAVRGLAKSWPKLRTLTLGIFLQPLNQTFVSLTTLRILADNCPELEYLLIPLDISTIPPFDDITSKSLRHNMAVLILGSPAGVHPPDQTLLQCQIQVARHLDLIFPYLKTIYAQDENWSGLGDLVRLCQDVRRGQ